MTMIPLYRPGNPADLALAESLLIASDIPYFVHNHHFSGLYPGVQVELYNVCTIMVPEVAASEAHEVLQDLGNAPPDTVATPIADNIKPETTNVAPGPGFLQILRMVAECFLCGWFVPAKAPEDHSSE
jgi:hypothetical protein